MPCGVESAAGGEVFAEDEEFGGGRWGGVDEVEGLLRGGGGRGIVAGIGERGGKSVEDGRGVWQEDVEAAREGESFFGGNGGPVGGGEAPGDVVQEGDVGRGGIDKAEEGVGGFSMEPLLPEGGGEEEGGGGEVGVALNGQEGGAGVGVLGV